MSREKKPVKSYVQCPSWFGWRFAVLFFWFGCVLGIFVPRVSAQGADAFGPSSAVPKDGSAKKKAKLAEDGLKNATPSNDAVEFDQSDDTLNGDGEFSDLPESTNQATSAPKNSTANFGNGGEDLFGNSPDGGNATLGNPTSGAASGKVSEATTDAFGADGGADLTGDSAANAKSATPQNTKSSPEIIDAAVTPNPEAEAPSLAPPNPAANVPLPNSALGNGSTSGSPPANAQVLLNEIKKEDAPTANLDAAASPPPPPQDSLSSSAGQSGGSNGSAPSAAPPSGDVPPTAKELPPPNEFAGAPPIPGTMRIMAEGEAPQEYRVQPGDTLYDICDQLIDEAGYWPKLWSINPEIKNPHFIFPGMKLGFYPGDDETPPYLQVIQEEDVIPIDKGSLNEIALVKENVSFSEELTAAAEQVIEVVGPDQVEVGSEIDEAILSGGRVYNGSDIRLQVPGFIFTEDKSELGYVLGGRNGGLTAAPGQEVVIEPTGQLSTGQTYTVLRRHDTVTNPVSGEDVGVLYYFVANVKIIRSVGSDVFIGKVQDNLLGVQADDVIVDYISTYRTIPTKHSGASYTALDAVIVAFEFADGEIGGDGHFAFLDKGSGAGVSPGMYVRVYQKPGYLMTSSGDADLPEDWQGVATMRIIDVTDAGSVGYLIDSSQEVRIGDLTKKP